MSGSFASPNFTPTGNISANTYQGAIAELDSETVHNFGNESIAGIKTFTDTTESTSTTTGTVITSGGLGVAKNANIGGDLNLQGLHSAGRFLLRGYYIWLDATGLLRYKSSAPSSDTDGTPVSLTTSSFRATKNNTLQTQTTDNTVVSWQTEEFDDDNVFASNTFTAPNNSRWVFSGAVLLTNNDGSSQRNLGLSLRVNGTTKARLGTATVVAGGGLLFPFCVPLSLSSGNTVDLIALNFGVGTSYSVGSSALGAETNYFSGFRIK